MWGAMGAPPVAESSYLSEWQRSAGNEGLCRGACRAPQQGIGPYMGANNNLKHLDKLEFFIFNASIPSREADVCKKLKKYN